MSSGREHDELLAWDYISVYITGLFTWELAMTFDFDWSFISGRRKLKWPLIPYFICRYSFLGSLITFHMFELITDKRLDCQVLYTFLGIFSNISVASASICLAIRAVTIWLHNRVILFVIGIPCLVQWALILRDVVYRHADWSDIAQHCVVLPIPLPEILLLYFPAMMFDFLVLIVSAIGLLKHGPLRSKLQVVVFKQGLVYFIVTFAANLLPVAFIFAPVPISITLVSTSAATFTTVVVSCRVVRDLVLFAEDGDRRHNALPTTNLRHGQLPLDCSVPPTEAPILSTVLIYVGKPINSQNSENTTSALHSESGTGESI